MKLRRKSGDADRVQSIVEMATGLIRSDDRKKYSLGIEFAITELVRDEMRSLAQRERHFPSANDLLRLAIERVSEKIETALAQTKGDFDLDTYVHKVRTSLRFPAMEIQSLGEKLAESRDVERLGAKEDMISDSGRHFVVHELGLRHAIQGMLVEPTEECQEINIDAIREQPRWQVEGEWFPYEVLAEDFVFVIDDDGSVFVSTANLPPELRKSAVGLLRQVAELLYT